MPIEQLNEETRICFRDSLYRLASSSKDKKRKRDESRTTETTAVASAPKMKGVSSRYAAKIFIVASSELLYPKFS